MTYAKGDVYRGEWKEGNFVLNNGNTSSRNLTVNRRGTLVSSTTGPPMSSQKSPVSSQKNIDQQPPLLSEKSRSVSPASPFVSQKYNDQSEKNSEKSRSLSPVPIFTNSNSRRSSRNMMDPTLLGPMSQKLLDSNESGKSRQSPTFTNSNSRRSSRGLIDPALLHPMVDAAEQSGKSRGSGFASPGHSPLPTFNYNSSRHSSRSSRSSVDSTVSSHDCDKSPMSQGVVRGSEQDIMVANSTAEVLSAPATNAVTHFRE